MATVLCDRRYFAPIDAVFFDKDGTLANVADYLTRLGQRQADCMETALPGTKAGVLKALGFDNSSLSPQGLLAVGSRSETIEGIASAAAVEGYSYQTALAAAAAATAAADREISPKEAFTPLIPGAAELLARLKDARIKLALTSADSQENLQRFVTYYSLSSYFDHIQGTGADRPSKTAMGFLKTARQALRVAPERSMVIGDARSDYVMARNDRAAACVLVLGGWPVPQKIYSLPSEKADQALAPAVCTVEKLSQIIAIS